MAVCWPGAIETSGCQVFDGGPGSDRSLCMRVNVTLLAVWLIEMLLGRVGGKWNDHRAPTATGKD